MPWFQTWFTTYLAARLAPADVVATLATVPTPTSGRMLLINGNITEWISYTGVSGSTITGLTRNLSQTADPVTWGTWLDWGAGTKILMVVMHDQYVDKESAFPIPGFTTVQRDALTMSDPYFTGTYPLIYNTTDGQYQYYNGSAWAAFATGTVADATDLIGGKVKILTADPGNTPVVLNSTSGRYQATAGTAGTPSSTNKFVTNDDTTWTGSITRGGIWATATFGNGVDGNVTIASGTTTLTRDMFYNNLTLQTGAILESAWFMIFVAGTLTQEGTGYIRNNGGAGGAGGTGWNGSNGVNGTAGTAGTAWAAAPGGTLPASIAWVAGGAGGAGSNLAWSNASAGTNGIAATNALGSNGVTWSLVWGGGGSAVASGWNGWAYGSLATITASKSKIADYNSARTFACFLSGTLTQFWNNAGNASAGGGGGGAGNNNGTGWDGRGGGGGGGGGSGGNGWNIVVFAKTIVTASNTLIQAIWGNGGNGGTGGNGGGGSTQFGVGGGGGGSKGLGWNWGLIVLVYKTLTSGTIVTDVAAGTAGTNGSGGTGTAPGSNGTAATSTTTTSVAGQVITITL